MYMFTFCQVTGWSESEVTARTTENALSGILRIPEGHLVRREG
jgi:hypothetical protein